MNPNTVPTLRSRPMLRSRRPSTVFTRGVLLAAMLAFAVAPAAVHADDTDEGQVTITVPAAVPLPQPPPGTPPSGTTDDTPPGTTPSGTTPSGTVPTGPPPSGITPVQMTPPGSLLPVTSPLAAIAGTGSAPKDTPAPTEPAIPGTPATNGDEAKLDHETYQAGGWAVVTAKGFTPGEQVQVVLYSEPKLIGNVPAKADGTFEHRFAIPDDLAAGRHTVQLTGWASKHIATADLFVTTGPLSADASVPVIPDGVWWAIGVLAVLLLLGALWWVIRIMRAPTAKFGAA